MAKSIRDFEGMIGKGEMGRRASDGPSFDMCEPIGGPAPDPARFGPPADGFQAQTVVGTARAVGTGWNQENWDWSQPQTRPGPTNPAGRNNRTGE